MFAVLTFCFVFAEYLRHQTAEVEQLQERTHLQLSQYELQRGLPMSRVSRLLLRLPSLRALNPVTMEEVFFSGLIGNVQIDAIIPYILKMESSDYTASAGLAAFEEQTSGHESATSDPNDDDDDFLKTD